MTFEQQIKKFNEMYGLPYPATPNWSAPGGATRVANFQNILSEELSEGDDLQQNASAAKWQEFVNLPENKGRNLGELQSEFRLNLLTELADWLGDIVVYCTSEAARFGIPMSEVLTIIMESNFSKLGEDGKPIHDPRGKVGKGPNYWKPEPRIRELLKSRLAAGKEVA